jgi:hypothetical protein
MTVKQMPPPSADLLFFPASDTDYTHFQDAEQNKFDDTADGFSPVNAWWLADAALLAYWDAARAATIWERADCRSRRSRMKACNVTSAAPTDSQLLPFAERSPTTGTISLTSRTSDDRLERLAAKFIAGSWTRTAHLAQLDVALTDLKPRKVGSPDTVWAVRSLLCRWITSAVTNTCIPLARRLSATGSSPDCLISAIPADASVTSTMWTSSCIWRRIGVLVGTYSHVKERKYIDAAGGISTGSPSMFELLSLILIPRVAPPVIGRPPQDILLSQALVDHTPRRYAVRIWNDYDRLPRVRGAPCRAYDASTTPE